MLDVDEGRRPAVERIAGPGYGDYPAAEGRVLRDVGDGPQPDAHLVQAEGVRGGQPDTGHAQLRAQWALWQGHALTVHGEVRLALGLWSRRRCYPSHALRGLSIPLRDCLPACYEAV